MAAMPIDVGGPALYTTGLQIWLTLMKIFSPLRLLGLRPRVAPTNRHHSAPEDIRATQSGRRRNLKAEQWAPSSYLLWSQWV